MMKEKPILFKGDMVKAILDGRKTQTRRVMKPQPEPCAHGGHWWPSNAVSSMVHVEDELQAGVVGWEGLAASCCPHGDIRDRLWVRETFIQGVEYDDGCPTSKEKTWYRASDPDLTWDNDNETEHNNPPWRPSIHMPRKLSRITLEITGVRVQRLQEISEDDAQAEGFHGPLTGTDWGGVNQIGRSPKECLSELWDIINGPGAWDENPWVWAITFKRVPNA